MRTALMKTWMVAVLAAAAGGVLAHSETAPTVTLLATYDGGFRDDTEMFTVDPAGNVTIVIQADTLADGSKSDFVAATYGPDGTRKSVAVLDRKTDFDPGTGSTSLDGRGNTYASSAKSMATSTCQGTDRGFWVNGLNAAGAVAVKFRHEVVGEQFNNFGGVQVDSLGNVFVLGSISRVTSVAGCQTKTVNAVVKWDKSGVKQWVYEEAQSPAVGTFVGANSLLPDGKGGFFLVGTTATTVACSQEIRIAKVTAAGALDAAFGTGGVKTDDWGAEDSLGWFVSLDEGGNVVVTGSSVTCVAPVTTVAMAARYDGATGSRLAVLNLGNPNAANVAMLTAFGADGSGGLVAAKLMSDPNRPNTLGSYVLTKYGPTGTLIWTITESPTDSGSVSVDSAEIDLDGNVYVVVRSDTTVNTGTSSESYSTSFRVVKYAAADGHTEWSAIPPALSGKISRQREFGVDKGGNVY
ncbi:MAG: hypothetical protein AAB368_11420, partial [bacterium]